MSEITTEVQKIIEPIAAGLDLELVDLEYHASGRRGLLRILIDKKHVSLTESSTDSYVTVEDCALLSKMVSRALDHTDIFQCSYRLEVSSPGLDRPLKREEDFIRFKDKLCKITTSTPCGTDLKRKNFSGRLKGVNQGQVIIESQEGMIEISGDKIVKANLIPEI